MCHAIQDRGLTIWTSTDIREHPAANWAPTPGIAKAQPARKTRSDTFEVSWTKHRGMHGACSTTSRELVAGIRDLSSTLIQNNNSPMNTTLNNSNRRHQLSISVLNDIDTYDGKQGHKLDWLANIENAATLVEEDEVMVAKEKLED